MTEDRRDPEIVVFGVEDGMWAASPWPGRAADDAGPENGAGDAGSRPLSAGEADEIRQGDDPDRQRHPMPAGMARLGVRVTLRARRMAPEQVAIAVVSLIVVAFVAGVLVGRRSHHAVADQASGFIPFTQALGDPPPSFRLRFSVPDPVPPVSAGPLVTVAPSAVYAMQLKATPVNQARQSQEIRDAGAVHGPWSVIVRRSDGSLGRHGAVITYPVPSVRSGRAIRIGRTVHQIAVSDKIPSASNPAVVTGHADAAGGIVWPLNGKFARIRGDLGRSMLTTLAARVSIRHGHPAVTELPTGLRVIVSEPYRAPVVTQSRYTDSLRVDSGPIDGLIYSEVVIGGASFEEALYSEAIVPGGAISGDPAVRSPVGGGSATLAWEVAPGIVAFVGYAGGLVPSAATPSLTELADGGHLLGRAQWTATHPFTNRGENDYT